MRRSRFLLLYGVVLLCTPALLYAQSYAHYESRLSYRLLDNEFRRAVCAKAS